jgi:alginate O-acetyltransferase complex protein AlgJ
MARWFALPLLIGAAAILIPPAVMLYDGARTIAGAKVRPSVPLAGVTLPVTPHLSAAALLDGVYQSQVAKSFGSLSRFYPSAVRLKNEVFFRLFNVSGVPSVVVGPKGVLVERNYTDELCVRDPAVFRQFATAWLPQLKKMQGLIEGQGKTFVYVISPSKPSLYPQDIPPGMNCPSTPAMRAEVGTIWRAMLTDAKIHYVDTTAILAEAAPRFPFPLFPRGGTHWNQVGSALAAQAIAASLNARRSDGVFGSSDFTWTISHDPQGDDHDLALLMNLFRPRLDYPVPELSVRYVPPAAPCHPIHVAIIGDSFMHQIADYLVSSPCHPEFDMWEYWHAVHLIWQWPSRNGRLGPMDPALRASSVFGADVIIYEENETTTARSEYGPVLLDFLQRAAPHP